MRFLCLSDIHGHAAALSAVLATAERRGYDGILVAGDICFPGPAPLTTWRRLNQLGARCVQGIGDRAIATLDTSRLRPRDDDERQRLARLLHVRRELGPGVLRQLAKLPQQVRQPLGSSADGHLLLVHGSPFDPLEPMSHDMDDRVLSNLLADDPASLVLCGGSHLPFDRVVKRQPGMADVPMFTRIVNLGSVGEAPSTAVSSGGGARHAHATFVEFANSKISVEQFVVPLARAA